MPLEIILNPPLVQFLDLEGKVIGSRPLLADFDPLCIHATIDAPKQWDSQAYPYAVTHKRSGMLINVFPSADLACCAARQWRSFDWTLPPDGLPSPWNRAQRAELYRLMRDTAIFAFSGRKGPA